MKEVFITLVIIGGFISLWKWMNVLKATRTSPGYSPRMIVFYLLTALSVLIGLNTVFADLLFQILKPFGITQTPSNYAWYSLTAYVVFCISAILISKYWKENNKKKQSQETGNISGINVGPIDSGGGHVNIQITQDPKKKKRQSLSF